MTVAAILSEKGTDVATAKKDQTISEIAGILASKKIGAVVIVDDANKVCGIISERDIVRELASDGAGCLDKPCSSGMTGKVISCSVDNTINEVMGVMTKHRFRHMPVIDDGKLGGIISIGDVVKRKIEQAERDAEELRNYIAAS